MIVKDSERYLIQNIVHLKGCLFLCYSKIREALGLDKTMHSGKGEKTRPFNCSNLPKWLSLIHKALGLHKNQQLVGSAAAPLSVDTILYFQSLDIMIGEFFGSTETSGPQTSCMEGKPTKKFYFEISIPKVSPKMDFRQVEQGFCSFFAKFLPYLMIFQNGALRSHYETFKNHQICQKFGGK